MRSACVAKLLASLVAGTVCVNAAQPNVLFIAIDDLRNDLGAYGVPYAKTPEMDSFAKTARLFSHHYVQVPTCGASRCALMRGRYPSMPAHVGNNGIKETHSEWSAQSLPAVFRERGYRTLALGKITHYPGNLTGKNWATPPEEFPGVWDKAWIPDGPWKTPEAIMHGYANGAARKPGKSPPWEAHDGADEAYPDAWVAAEAIKTLKDLSASRKPWFFAIGFFKPHLPFAAPKKWYDLHAEGIPDLPAAASAKPTWPSGWHKSGEFRGNYGHPAGRDPETDPEYARLMRRGYAASISYMDAQVGRVLAALRELELEKNTIVVVWGDNGFLLGEHAIWGKHCLYEHAVRTPLIIRVPGLKNAGKTASAPVETVDILPTLADFCQLRTPAGLDGRSLRPLLENPDAGSPKPAVGFWSGGLRTVRTERWRLIARTDADGQATQVELFDYKTDPLETRNHVATQPEVVRELLTVIGDRRWKIGDEY